MDTEIFICARCSLKNFHLKAQPCGHVYCRRCIAKAESNEQPICMLDHSSSKDSIGSDANSEEELCCYCNEVLDLDKILIHYDNCEMHPVNCIFCNGKFIRRSIKIHLLECVRNLSRCKFSPLGCQFEGTQLDIERHEGDNVHVELMMNLLLNHQTELKSLKEVVDNTQGMLSDIAANKSPVECPGLHPNLEENECWIEMKSIIGNLKETIKSQEMEIYSRKQQIIDFEQKQNKKMEEFISSTLLEQNQKIEELKSQNTQLELNYVSLKESLSQTSKITQINMETANVTATMKTEELSRKMDDFEEQTALQSDQLKTLIKQQSEQSDNMQHNENTLTNLITANNQLVKTVVEDKKILNDKIDAVQKSQLETDKQFGNLQRKQHEFQDTFSSAKDKELTNLRNQLAPNLSSSPFIWKVDNFEQLQANAKSGKQNVVYSEPFYSNAFGYKMRLELYPNGEGDGKGTHLSVSIQVMKSENDAILNWPIEYCAKFGVLDQSKHKDHHFKQMRSNLVRCKNRNFDKPLNAVNGGWGLQTFLALDALKPLFLVDDTIFIKLDLTITSLK